MRGSAGGGPLFYLATRGTKMNSKSFPPLMVGCHSQPSLNRSNSKRKRFSPLTLEQEEIPRKSPQYLVVTRVDGESFLPVNPFLISKSVEGICW